MAYTFELETTVIGRHVLGVHETCVHETFGTVRSIFITIALVAAIRDFVKFDCEHFSFCEMLTFYFKYLKLSSKCSQCKFKVFQTEINFSIVNFDTFKGFLNLNLR